MAFYSCESTEKNTEETRTKANIIATEKLIPVGFVLTDSISGDLTGDGINEFLILIKGTDSSMVVEDEYGKIVDRNRRGIMVFTIDEGQAKLLSQNLNGFSSENEYGGVYMPPELYLEIFDETLEIHFGHGRYGYWYYNFKYRINSLELIKYFSSSNRGPITERELLMDFISMKKLTRVNTNLMAQLEEEVFEEVEEELKFKNLIKLSEVEDFDTLLK